MSTYSIDAAGLRRMFLSGVFALEGNKSWINDLNVFPVPDGDTGTNMCMTLASAVKEVRRVEKDSIGEIAKAISFGSLRGARGNSGVIMSQLLRGFCREITDKEFLDSYVIACAFSRAVETAYKAVMKPKEGTILTVARGVADKMAELAERDEDLETMLGEVLQHGDEVLAYTPELLPVLKEAGVVDSGGQGLMVFLHGVEASLNGKDVKEPEEEKAAKPEKTDAAARGPVNTEHISTADIKFGYCTEFLINLKTPISEQQVEGFRAYLESLGDSIVLVADEEIVKVHVHTNDPGLALQKALTFGSLTNMKIDNMRFEHEERLIKDASRIAEAERTEKKAAPKEKKPVAFLAASVGAGLTEIFTSLGVDHMIEGGQTMNPSTEDMLQAIDEVNAETVFILPNNSNIILAAEQARELSKDSRVIVIPTKTIPQGVTAMMNYMPEASVEENAENMQASLASVLTGEVTYAVRNTKIAGKEIHEGDIMGLGGPDGLYAVGSEITATTEEMITAMMTEDAGLVTLYYGDTVSASDAEALGRKLQETYPAVDIQVLNGGQPIYYYIVSVE